MSGEKREKNASRGKGKPFEPGNKGGGRKPLPKDILAARAMATEEMLRTVIEVRRMTTGDVKKLDLDKVPLGKRAIISAYAKNDYKGIKDYEDRLFGKAHETLSLDGEFKVTDPIEIIDYRGKIAERLKITNDNGK